MTKEELEKLAQTWQQKADAAFLKHQESGAQRDLTAYYKAADIADGLRIGANAADMRQAYGAMRVHMMDFCNKALEAKNSADRQKVDDLIEELCAYGRLMGFLWDRGDVSNLVLAVQNELQKVDVDKFISQFSFAIESNIMNRVVQNIDSER